ncbi:hypothetical protein [Brachybacterium sacelli]|uniref:hypothetical protein n=1 Tax=Brachybacterium sacelli TaxID=173364 RepID=UPI0036103810
MGTDIAGLNFEQATVNFLSGNAAMVVWNHGVFHRAVAEADFNWGWMTFPARTSSWAPPGTSGAFRRAKNKELALRVHRHHAVRRGAERHRRARWAAHRR